MKHFILVVSFLSGLSAFAGAWDNGNTWFVATNGADVAASSGGGTEAAPFRTLQFAHDQASAGDTIKLTPGVYDEGEVFGAQHTNRLVVSKKLRFVATGSRDETHIVGRHSTASEYGMGPDAIRCVYVNEKSSGSEFHNLTFRDGASNSAGGDPYNNVNNGASSAGGGAVTCYGRNADAQQRAYFVDCVISNCAATWGAACMAAPPFAACSGTMRATASAASAVLPACGTRSSSASSRRHRTVRPAAMAARS